MRGGEEVRGEGRWKRGGIRDVEVGYWGVGMLEGVDEVESGRAGLAGLGGG